jgi:hypothetical protein
LRAYLNSILLKVDDCDLAKLERSLHCSAATAIDRIERWHIAVVSVMRFAFRTVAAAVSDDSIVHSLLGYTACPKVILQASRNYQYLAPSIAKFRPAFLPINI